MVLTEGLSRVSSAELTLFTKDPAVRMDKLKDMIGKNATVEMTQFMSDNGRICRRWFSGTITEAVHCGIVHMAKEHHTMKCGLLIQSPEVSMKYSAYRRAFVDMLPGEVIRTLVKPYRFPCTILDSVSSDVSNWADPDDFYQNGESDYEFFMSILMKYGLSYTMVTGKPSNQMVSPSEMYISSGTSHPVSAFEMPHPANPISCSCREAADRFHYISSWRMSSHIGIEAAEINFEDGSNFVSQQAGDKQGARRVFFNHSPLGELTLNNAENVLKNYLSSFQQTDTCWEGELTRLDAIPGMNLVIPDFYGDDDGLKAKITSATVHFTAPWPTTLLGDAAPGKEDAVLGIHVKCMDLAPGKGFYTPFSRNTGSFADAGNTVSVGFSLSGTVDPGSNTGRMKSRPAPFQAIQAVVCDVSGDTGNDLAVNRSLPLRNDAYEFYACYKAGNRTEVVSVTMMMPLGGLGEGLFHVPRQGDKVLIGCVNGARYYLMGYLPDSKRPFMDGGLLNGKSSNVNEMTVLRGNTPGRNPMSYITGQNNVALGQMERLESAGRDASKQGPNHQFSEIGIYHNYDGQKK